MFLQLSTVRVDRPFTFNRAGESRIIFLSTTFQQWNLFIQVLCKFKLKQTTIIHWALRRTRFIQLSLIQSHKKKGVKSSRHCVCLAVSILVQIYEEFHFLGTVSTFICSDEDGKKKSQYRRRRAGGGRTIIPEGAEDCSIPTGVLQKEESQTQFVPFFKAF